MGELNKEGIEKKIEIMAPVGSYESLEAAIKAGCDSVYFGIEQLNMRARSSNNFTISDLKKIVKRCSAVNVNSYLTVNTILYDHDLNLMRKIIDSAKRAGVSAIIASDLSAIGYANSIGVSVHISTQCNISNIEAVRFYAKFADVMVLARELTLKQVEYVCDEIKKRDIRGPSGELVRVEIFAHGALCVAISGKCYMSLATDNASANRGACLQNCRQSYRVIREEENEDGEHDELIVDNKYIMSPKDLCTIGFLDKLISAGVFVLKLEGRGRSADYVYTVTRVYREAVDSIFNGTYSKEKIEKWIEELGKVYNRGFWHGGYYLGKRLGEWSGVYGSLATKEKIKIGICKHYYPRSKVGEFVIESDEINVGDEILITGKTTGIIQQKVESIYLDENPVVNAKKGDLITIKLSERVRKNDKLFIVVDKNKNG